MHVSLRQLSHFALVPLLLSVAAAQAGDSNQAVQPPVSYASVSQLNTLLSQLEQTSQTTQLDLAKLRIDKWKTDGNTKKQTQSNLESVQRNLQTALPTIVGELRGAPESFGAGFKLYRNLDALYDVFGTVVESAGAFGTKDEFQSLENDLAALENSRRSLGDRLNALADSKDAELARLHNQVRTLQASIPPPPAKKVIVDDTAPVKKTPTKRKTVPKPPANPTGTANPPK